MSKELQILSTTLLAEETRLLRAVTRQPLDVEVKFGDTLLGISPLETVNYKMSRIERQSSNSFRMSRKRLNACAEGSVGLIASPNILGRFLCSRLGLASWLLVSDGVVALQSQLRWVGHLRIQCVLRVRTSSGLLWVELGGCSEWIHGGPGVDK